MADVCSLDAILSSRDHSVDGGPCNQTLLNASSSLDMLMLPCNFVPLRPNHFPSTLDHQSTPKKPRSRRIRRHALSCVALRSVASRSVAFRCERGFSLKHTGVRIVKVFSIAMAVFVSVCLCVSPRAYLLSRESHFRTSANFLCRLPIALARSCPGGVVICYVVPVLWITSFSYSGPIGGGDATAAATLQCRVCPELTSMRHGSGCMLS